MLPVNYVNLWKNTRAKDALNYLRTTMQCPIGSTSAGNAIQGRYRNRAPTTTTTSAAALANPFDSSITVGRNVFLNNPYLVDTITDDCFTNPDRRGRLVTFIARTSKDDGIAPPPCASNPLFPAAAR